MSKKAAPERITLTFDLHDLPTAQHRAGLAGLILQIDSMGLDRHKRDSKLIPVIEEETLTPTSATITFTPDSMQGVFDDLYHAKLVDGKFPSPKKKKKEIIPPDDIELVEIKGKQEKRYVYRNSQTVALAPCIKRHLQPGAEPWLELWRRMVWEVLRNNQARAPFDQTAASNPCTVGAATWNQICKFKDKIEKSQFETSKISGALMIGAQADNAESVPFVGRVDHNLLLHFWQIVVLTFVPFVVNRKEKKAKRLGYVLTIPDVADLREFRHAFPRILGSLIAEHPERTPTAARVDLPAQATLEVLRKLREGAGDERAATRAVRRIVQSDRGTVQGLTTDKALREDWSGSVRAIESYHMLKVGNNLKMLSFKRVAGRPGLVEDYEHIEKTYRNPLFRASLMRALIEEKSWHAGMIELFAEYPWPFFIEGDDTPRYLPRFGRDAKELFQAFFKDIHDMKIEEMNDDERLKHLGLIIQRLVNNYVDRRAEKKEGKKISEFEKVPIKDEKGEPRKSKDGKVLMRPLLTKKFRQTQQRVCTDAFLGMRSRHDQDFIEFFAGTICSLDPPLTSENLQFLIRILRTQPDPNAVGQKRLNWEDVKALAMIAVSARSFQVRPRETETPRSPK